MDSQSRSVNIPEILARLDIAEAEEWHLQNVFIRKYREKDHEISKFNNSVVGLQLTFSDNAVIPNLHIIGSKSALCVYFERIIFVFSPDLEEIFIHLELGEQPHLAH